MKREELVSECRDAVVYAARNVQRRYGRWVEQDDVMQEMWLWVFEHPDTTRRLLADRESFLTRRLVTVGERYARREKAAYERYSPDDEAFYSLTMIRDMLPYALDSNATPPQEQQEVRVYTSGDGYGTWEAMLADVRGAFSHLDDTDQKLLTRRFRDEATFEVIASADGVSTSAVFSRVNRIVKRLQRRLGGASPYREPAGEPAEEVK
jgi:RNA polymerase sigma factor (sigma-70 family)